MLDNPYRDLLIDVIENKSFTKLAHIAPFFTRETESVIKDIQKQNLSVFNQQKWKDLYEKHKDKPLVLYEMITSDQIPFVVAYDITKQAIAMYNKAKVYSHEKVIAEKIILKAMEKPLEPEITKEIYKVMDKDLLNILQTYTSERLICSMASFQHCPFSQVVLQDLCRLIMPYKKNKTTWYKLPFRFVDNSGFLSNILEDPKCNETVREAIVNNFLIPQDVRMEAFNGGVNFNNIFFAPTEAKDVIFNSVVETYTDLNLNPKTRKKHNFTKKELNVYNNAINFMTEKLMFGFFDEQHQLDLLYRLHDLHGGKSRDAVLGLLFKHTTSKKVLNTAKLFHTNADVEIAYQNIHMDKQLVLERCENLLNEINKKQYKKIPEAKYNTLEFAIKNYTLGDEDYNVIFNFDINNGLMMHCAQSHYTPDRILKQIIDNCNDILKNTSILPKKPSERASFVEKIDEIRWHSILSKIIKNHTTDDEFMKMHNMINHYKVNFRTTVQGEKNCPTTKKDSVPLNECDYIEMDTLYSILPQSKNKQHELLLSINKETENYPKDSSIYAKLKEMKAEILQSIYVHKLVEEKMYDKFNVDVLTKIKKDIITDFCKNSENDIRNFYNNFDLLLDDFTKVQMEIDLKEIEFEKEKCVR